MNTYETLTAAVDELFTIAALVKSAEIAAADVAHDGEPHDMVETVQRINRLCLAACERIEATRERLQETREQAYSSAHGQPGHVSA